MSNRKIYQSILFTRRWLFPRAALHPFAQLHRGSWPPSLFLKRIKMPFSCLYDLLIIIVKLERNEIRNLPVIFLLFLNLKNIIPSYILNLTNLSAPFLWIRPLPSTIPSSPLATLVQKKCYFCIKELILKS